MPSVYSWKQAIPYDQLFMSSDMVIHHNRHYPFGGPANATDRELSVLGLEEMTAAVQNWYPVPDIQNSVANFRQVYGLEYRAFILNNFIVRGAGQLRSFKPTTTPPNWPSTDGVPGCHSEISGRCIGNWKIFGNRSSYFQAPGWRSATNVLSIQGCTYMVQHRT